MDPMVTSKLNNDVVMCLFPGVLCYLRQSGFFQYLSDGPGPKYCLLLCGTPSDASYSKDGRRDCSIEGV